MVKDGEDWHGLQTTNLKSLAKLFKPFNRDWAPSLNRRNLETPAFRFRVEDNLWTENILKTETDLLNIFKKQRRHGTTRVYLKHKSKMTGNAAFFKFPRRSLDGNHFGCALRVKHPFSNFPGVVRVWTENIFKMKLFEKKNDVMTIISFPCLSF